MVTEPAMPVRRRGVGIVTRIVVLLLVAAALWYGLARIDWPALWRAIASADLVWGFAAVAAAVVSHLVRAHRWRLLIPDGLSISLSSAFSATIIGYMFNNIVPRSGELARPWLLARKQKRPLSTMIASVVVERILDGISLALIVIALALTGRELIERLIPGRTAEGLVAAIVVPVGALVIVIILAARTTLGDRIAGFVARRLPERFSERIRTMLDDFRSGLSFGGPGASVAIIVTSILIWLGYFLGTYFAILAFGFDQKYGLGLNAALVTLGVTSIGITIAPTPGGFLVYHSFCIAVLWGVFGVPRDEAAAFALAAHGAPYIVVTALGGIYALFEDVSVASMLRRPRNLPPAPAPPSDLGTDPRAPQG